MKATTENTPLTTGDHDGDNDGELDKNPEGPRRRPRLRPQQNRRALPRNSTEEASTYSNSTDATAERLTGVRRDSTKTMVETTTKAIGASRNPRGGIQRRV